MKLVRASQEGGVEGKGWPSKRIVSEKYKKGSSFYQNQVVRGGEKIMEEYLERTLGPESTSMGKDLERKTEVSEATGTLETPSIFKSTTRNGDFKKLRKNPLSRKKHT